MTSAAGLMSCMARTRHPDMPCRAVLCCAEAHERIYTYLLYMIATDKSKAQKAIPVL